MRTLILGLVAALMVALIPESGDVAHAQRQLTASGNGRGVTNAILGRVVDGVGNPLPGTWVTLLKPSVSRVDGTSRIGMVSATLGAVVNDRGEFRLENLPPGSYYPVAFPANLRPGPVTGPTRMGYDVTYYPNVDRAEDAKAVEVGPASTVTANITMVPAPLWVVRGSVVAPNGQPWLGGRLSVAHADGLFGLDSIALSIQSNGTFVVPNLPRGSYCLYMHEADWPASARNGNPFGARVTVVDRDVIGVRVAPIHMVKATGRLVLDPVDRVALAPSALRVGSAPFPGDCNPGPRPPGMVRDDLTFEVQTWPGPTHIRLARQTIGDVPATIRLNGVDVTKTGIDVKEETDVSDIVIEVARVSR